MKLKQITEAKYYRSHSVEAVGKRYEEISDMWEQHGSWNVGIDFVMRGSNSATAGVSVFNATTEEEFEQGVALFMKSMKVPYTEITDIEYVGEERMIGLVVYKGNITEARYAGKYDVKQVRAQYMRTGPSYHGVFFDSATINPEANHVLAKFNVVAGVPENEVRRQVREYHDINKIPFGEIVSIRSSNDDVWTDSDDWTVFVKYVGAPINEAKYANAVDIMKVNTAYQDAFDASNGAYRRNKTIDMARPSMYGEGKDVIIDCVLFVPNVDTKQQAIDAGKWFAKKYELPYTSIQANAMKLSSGEVEYNREWHVRIIYNPYGGTGILEFPGAPVA